MEFVQELDDEDTPDTALAPFVDEDCNEVDGYTGCDSQKALCEQMEAAMLAGQQFSEKVNGIMLEFNQVRVPKHYSVEGKHGLLIQSGIPIVQRYCTDTTNSELGITLIGPYFAMQ